MQEHRDYGHGYFSYFSESRFLTRVCWFIQLHIDYLQRQYCWAMRYMMHSDKQDTCAPYAGSTDNDINKDLRIIVLWGK